MAYTIRYVYEHVEVYDEQGNFMFSADNQKEAQREIEDCFAA